MIPARLLVSLASSVLSEHFPNFHDALRTRILPSSGNNTLSATTAAARTLYILAKREEEKHDTKFVVFACLIPVLVILSGVFAGLTLGYMSLDETQLNVLSVSGTP